MHGSQVYSSPKKLGGLAFFRPASLCGLARNLASLPVGHGLQPPFAADPTAFAAHFGHYLRDQGWAGGGGVFGGLYLAYGFKHDSAGILNRIETGRTLGSASSLWHTPTQSHGTAAQSRRRAETYTGRKIGPVP